mmetsp:Transcript_1349/g.1756  ORF Transcript_1349/g.1756 Transcript_1349/m.1756 type:complete len:239 (+) Transcript_1349:459-1175(+)
MPRIQKINDKVPVIFVGNKIDLRTTSAEHELTSLLNHHFEEFKQVQMGIECSAKAFIGLIDVIAAAQSSVLYPLTPLYDSIEKQLKPDYVKALLRIFRMRDSNSDGIMDDDDLKDLQRDVFGQVLEKTHITALKQTVVTDENDEEKVMKGLDFEAFQAIMKKFIQKQKAQTCWKMLDYFGYEKHLQIRKNIWDDNSIPEEVLSTARNFELTKEAISYLKQLFQAHANGFPNSDSNFID